MHREEKVLLAPYTTLGLGGPADLFYQIKTISDLQTTLQEVEERTLPYFVLGGGSNVIIPDEGYRGAILQIQIPGIRSMEVTSDSILYDVGAGVSWDEFVRYTIEQGLVGIESLSGIPGFVGASPIQNIGAYGTEAKETISYVRVWIPKEGEKILKPEDCQFSYRNSVFKSEQTRGWVVTAVGFTLSRNKPPTFRYAEVEKEWPLYLERNRIPMPTAEIWNSDKRILYLKEYRNVILELRKKKSMVLDSKDTNTRSVGSFFTNPILHSEEVRIFQKRCESLGLATPPLYEESESRKKTSAAWLIENAGIQKGQIFPGGVRVSTRHCLALVNESGTSKALLDMATQIQTQVLDRFGILLEREPVLLV